MTPPKYRYRDGSIGGSISIKFDFTENDILTAIDNLFESGNKVSKVGIYRRLKSNFFSRGNETHLQSRFINTDGDRIYPMSTLIPYGIKFYPEFFTEPKYKEYVRDQKLNDLLK
jgi:hypothetical protein